ncbi:MAG: hypothetical protein B6D61_13805, partial [Bacteroidetes bacterium 4484_249]
MEPMMIYYDSTAAYYELNGVYYVHLTTPYTISTDGTYWVSVTCDVDYAVGGQWFWTRVDNTAPIGNDCYWRNPGDGFGTGAITWTSAT